MYELKRKKRISEKLKVGDEVLEIKIDTNALLPEYSKLKDALIIAQNEASKEPNEVNLEKLGGITVKMIEVLMGKENAQKVFAFYEDNYFEMMEEVVPFVNEVIVPQFTAQTEATKKKYRKRYKK